MRVITAFSGKGHLNQRSALMISTAGSPAGHHLMNAKSGISYAKQVVITRAFGNILKKRILDPSSCSQHGLMLFPKMSIVLCFKLNFLY